MKKLLFLLFAFATFTMHSQTANGTETQFEGLQITSPQTVTSPAGLATVGTDGTVGKVDTSLIVTPNATSTVKGKIKLAGDISGTADLPTVPDLKKKLNLIDAIQFGAKADGITDDTAILQLYLNSNQGIYLFPKGIYIVSGIDVNSNSKLIFEKGSILYLKNGSNRPALQNINFQSNTDSNIEIEGLYLNGNEANQIHTGVIAPYIGEYTSGIRFFGVKNLVLNNIYIYRSRTFGIWLNRINKGVFTNITFDQNLTTPDNQDGLHVNGGCNDLYIQNIVGATNDDTIALNADDGALGSNVVAGSITNVLIDGVVFKNSLNGIRILSTVSRLDQVKITNISGSIRDNVVAISTYQLGGLGNFGSIIIDGVNVTTNTPLNVLGEYGGYILINDKVEYVKISNVYRIVGTDNRPTIRIQNRTNAQKIELENITVVLNPANTTYLPDVFMETATVSFLSIKNHKTTAGTYASDYSLGFYNSTIGRFIAEQLYYENTRFGLYLNNTKITSAYINNINSASIRYPFYLISDSKIFDFTGTGLNWWFSGDPNQYTLVDTSTINILNTGIGSSSQSSLFSLKPRTNIAAFRIIQDNFDGGFSTYADSTTGFYTIKRYSTGADTGNLFTLNATGKGVFSGTLTASPAAVGTELVTLNQLNAIPNPLVYAATMSQSSTSNPVATVVKNTLSGAIVWTRSSAGSFTGTLSGAFPVGKTIIIAGTNSTGKRVTFGTLTTSTVFVLLETSAGVPTDDSSQMNIKIEVYP